MVLHRLGRRTEVEQIGAGGARGQSCSWLGPSGLLAVAARGGDQLRSTENPGSGGGQIIEHWNGGPARTR
jgi:hypothetical protein